MYFNVHKGGGHITKFLLKIIYVIIYIVIYDDVLLINMKL